MLNIKETAMSEPEKVITILVNNKPVPIDKGEATGLQIKHAAAVPADFKLYLKRGAQLDEIADNQLVKLHEHEEFVAVSGQDVS
jgi:hypothetical protein